jgi:outer membrane protein OmpA-like peptidoglycan-associated protein
MKLRNALLAATMLALPVAAQAQPVTGLYVGAGVGGDYFTDTSVKTTIGNGKLTSKGGFAGELSVGYGLGNGLRLELEGDGIDSQSNAKKPAHGGGTLYSYGGFANALYDFSLGLPVFPYVGVGAGYQLSQFSGGTIYAPGGNPGFNVNTTSKGSFAAQGIVGVAYPLAAVPGLSLTAEYRLIATVSNEKFGGTYVNGTKSGAGTFKVDNQYNNQILVGLRYAFGVAPAPMAPAPAPAAVVAPAPAPARSYLVFFDWDKADLTARAQQIIAEAAQNATRVSATKIDVAGHADSSGTPAYNQTLSLRRANNVAAELVRLGVPKTEISITAYGDTKPLVPTAPGVREPQNRRVEIVLH